MEYATPDGEDFFKGAVHYPAVLNKISDKVVDTTNTNTDVGGQDLPIVTQGYMEPPESRLPAYAMDMDVFVKNVRGKQQDHHCSRSAELFFDPANCNQPSAPYEESWSHVPRDATETQASPNKESSTCLFHHRCVHCGTTRTPLWRNGPAGPKSLCNACGIRNKMGKLTSEYIPNAIKSPSSVTEGGTIQEPEHMVPRTRASRQLLDTALHEPREHSTRLSTKEAPEKRLRHDDVARCRAVSSSHGIDRRLETMHNAGVGKQTRVSRKHRSSLNWGSTSKRKVQRADSGEQQPSPSVVAHILVSLPPVAYSTGNELLN
eukprot:CAMPEP_0114256564 /NCGR_PEP_ID=MMETSP0058-20121206/18233_1 /TAXON_ID=36894 /ORGANISM="Pyramimonas parkeae, CCMP726" /LENGTH=317 /DNA_ID=CAMNT_0001371165 /DNA_START=445 /DNA_END=1396 /DNA_ORIENTATION=+